MTWQRKSNNTRLIVIYFIFYDIWNKEWRAFQHKERCERVLLGGGPLERSLSWANVSMALSLLFNASIMLPQSVFLQSLYTCQLFFEYFNAQFRPTFPSNSKTSHEKPQPYLNICVCDTCFVCTQKLKKKKKVIELNKTYLNLQCS